MSLETTCNRCRAPIVWARTRKDRRVAIDAHRREGGTIVLQHEAVREPPFVWNRDEAELAQHRREHAYRVKHGMEEPGPFTGYVHHRDVCPARTRRKAA